MILHIAALYTLSLLLQLAPLYMIVQKRQLQKYFVFFIAGSGFLLLNLIGSISSNITAYRLLPFHYANLAIAASFAVTYALMSRLDVKRPFVPLRERFALSQASDLSMKRYTGILALLSVASLVLFSAQGVLPLVFRFDLFGDWEALVQERIKIVQHPDFYWYSLGIFEIPLFLTVLSAIMVQLSRLGSGEAASVPWSRTYRIVASCSLILSIIYLNKQYLMYLLLALLLCHLVQANRLFSKKTGLFAAASFALLLFLYRLYAGSVSLWSIFKIIFHRIFEVYAWAGAVAFDLYPAHFPFLRGTSIVNPHGIFPYKQVIVSEILYPYIYIYPHGFEEIGFGNAPLPAIYENYVNFGWWGIAVGIVMVSAVLGGLTLMSWSRDLFWFVMSLFLTIKTLLLWQAPFWFGLIEPTLAVLVSFLVAIKLIVGRWPSTQRRTG